MSHLPYPEKRAQLVALLRGEVACPLLSALGECGAAQRMVAGAFTAEEVFPQAEPAIAAAVLEYLTQLGLLTAASADGRRSVTDAGRTVLGRWGAFALLHSYEEMFRQMGAMLAGASTVPPVNRARNITGSGQLHARKFFPTAVERLRGMGAAALVDIGCGDGTWLAHAAAGHALRALGLLDASALAVRTAAERLRAAGLPVAAEVTCDGLAVETWAPHVSGLPGPVVISLWFVLHEFSGGSTARVVEFFQRLHRCLPHAEVLLGEVVKLPGETLAAHHAVSIQPEYQLFHALSGQGLLEWGQLQAVRAAIPYDVVFEKEWDALPLPQGGEAPSHLLWHLRPRV